MPIETEYDLISQAFPNAESIGVYPPMIVVRYKVLPVKPWPISVAGLPAFFTTDMESMGFEYGKAGGSLTKVLSDFDARDHVDELLMDRVIAYFEEIHVAITSVLNLGGTWIITIPDGTFLKSLPFSIANSLCQYKFASEVEHRQEAVFRGTEPKGTVWDATHYGDLRPGMMISCGGSLATPELLTTSGIGVKDEYGSRYFTIASHGAPPGRESIYHPDLHGTLLGRVHDRLADSGIALVRLSPLQTYHNETFGAQLSDCTISSQRVHRIRDAFTIKRGDFVTMNSPFSGYCIGMHMGTEKKKVPSDDPVVPHIWITSAWSYFGNGIEEPMNGCCGAAILDDDGLVISFFRFVTSLGFGIGAAASTLSKWGYKVS
jgi:hypothetical protein